MFPVEKSIELDNVTKRTTPAIIIYNTVSPSNRKGTKRRIFFPPWS